MKLHMMAVALALPLMLLVGAPPAISQVHMEIGFRIGPPPPRYEVTVAPPFAHAVWVRGHWAWNAHAGNWVWVRGQWIARRPAYVWVDGSWHHGPRGWYWDEGRWEHRLNRDRGEYRGRDRDDHPGHEREIGHGRGG